MDYRILLIAPIAALVLSAGATAPRMPTGWMAADHAMPATHVPGELPKGYEIGLDPRPDASGLTSLSVRSVTPLSTQRPSVGAAQQEAWGYAGSRVRLSGQVRAEGVRGWAGLYIGAGGVLDNLALGIPGVKKRLPMGAAATSETGWQDVSVVFDVPADEPAIHLGLALVGEGQVWARALRFEVVGPQVPATTTPIAFDWALAREFFAKTRQMMRSMPPMPLANAALD